MMKDIVKFTCDGCGRVVETLSAAPHETPIPEGWLLVRMYVYDKQQGYPALAEVGKDTDTGHTCSKQCAASILSAAANRILEY